MEDKQKPISEMNEEEFSKLQEDVANGNEKHFKEEIEKPSEEDVKIVPETSEEKPKEEEPKGESDKGNPEDEGDKEDKGDSEDKNTPPTRKKSKKDHILDRFAKREEKRKSETENDDEINPNDRKLVEDVVEEKFGDTVEELKTLTLEREEEKDKLQDEAELNEFCSEHKEFAPYKEKIAKFWKDDSRKHLPLKAVAYEVAGDDLIMLGARKQKDADKKASFTTTGSDSKEETVEKTVLEMTDAEFEKYQNHVLHPER